MRWVDDDATKVSFRRSWQRWWLFLCIGAFFLVGASGIPASSHDGGYYGPDSGFVLGSRIFFGAIAAGAGYLMVRVLMLGIFTDRRGIVVRNWFGTERATWDEVAGFRPPTGYGAFRRTGLGIELHDRPTVYASLYSAGPYNSAAFADKTIAALEELRSAHAPPS